MWGGGGVGGGKRSRIRARDGVSIKLGGWWMVVAYLEKAGGDTHGALSVVISRPGRWRRG